MLCYCHLKLLSTITVSMEGLVNDIVSLISEPCHSHVTWDGHLKPPFKT